MKLKHYLSLLIVGLLSLSLVNALAISGRTTLFKINFQPNQVHEETFVIQNKEGYTSDYNIRAIAMGGADLTPYFTITPNRIEGIENGGNAVFSVRLEFPERLDAAGETETWIKVEIDGSSSGMIMAFPSLAIRYLIFILYPGKYITWDFSPQDMNINETKDFSVSVINHGEPNIDEVYAEIVVSSMETGEVVRQLRTNNERNIASWESRILSASFNSRGLMPGNYLAEATLYWDNNISKLEKEFRIGSKKVIIHDFTREFEIDAINKMDINIESAWNTKISNIYADVNIFDMERTTKLKSFKSLNDELLPWESKSILAYFDTSGLEEKEYWATIELKYEGATSFAEGNISVGKDIKGAAVVEETPAGFSLDLSVFASLLKPINLLILLLVFFVLLNIYLVFTMFKKKPKQTIIIDPGVVEHVRRLKEKYNNTYIKDMMLKKGWSEEKIDTVLKAAEEKR